MSSYQYFARQIPLHNTSPRWWGFPPEIQSVRSGDIIRRSHKIIPRQSMSAPPSEWMVSNALCTNRWQVNQCNKRCKYSRFPSDLPKRWAKMIFYVQLNHIYIPVRPAEAGISPPSIEAETRGLLAVVQDTVTFLVFVLASKRHMFECTSMCRSIFQCLGTTGVFLSEKLSPLHSRQKKQRTFVPRTTWVRGPLKPCHDLTNVPKKDYN